MSLANIQQTPQSAQRQQCNAATVWGLAPWDGGHAQQNALSSHLVGRLTELTGKWGQGVTSWALSLVRAAQRAHEPVAWIQAAPGSLYPPDMAAAGVSLENLWVVQIADSTKEVATAQLRAAELLLRSGGFGLVVIDWLELHPPTRCAWQGRLLALARQHHSAVLLLTDSGVEKESLGPLVQLRLASQLGASRPGEVQLGIQVVKQKGQQVSWPWQLRRRGVEGLIL